MTEKEPTELEQPDNGKLTEKQLRFCEEYLKDLNGAAAARRTGFSPKTSHIQACKLLMKANIQKYIVKLKKRISSKAIMTREEVLEELSLLARSSIENYIEIDELTGSIRSKPFSEMPKDTVRAIQSIEENRVIKEDAKGDQVTVYDKIKFKMHPKVKALEWLGKYHTLFEEKESKLGEMIIDNRNLNFTVIHLNGKGENIGETIKELKKMNAEIVKADVDDKGNNK